ncbi:PRC-barrel domain-containing protein [Paraburkholderia fungorum]|uniref:PRC-barrel domain-containing protein n=1 Tax=Paraburkholderia fungorum TaxID=134537 RepID=UPI0038B94822
MKRKNESALACRSTLVTSLTACVCLILSGSLLAAQMSDTSATAKPKGGMSSTTDMKPAQKCLNDLRAFDRQMRKNGYWLRGAGYGFGYGDGSPMYGYGAGEPNTLPPSRGSTPNGLPADGSYQSVRPAYEVRTLMTSASILARRGEQQDCESLLTASRAIYKGYSADMGRGDGSAGGAPNWRLRQIASAQPVTGDSTPFRSAELIGTSVVNPQSEDLGSINDIVLSPQSGKIAYLVVGRGGVFGIDEKNVPVPWADFKATTGVTMLVLDTTKGKMDAAPEVKRNGFGTHGDFEQQSQKVDKYWSAQVTN